ncbi:hypothetical protein E2562_028828 [Oryza meyeriana var. granulata]|uniref:Uncharacterized protein n=1 Tax=Oryza meyeriana var. granulata TaxID=110450 RepID=A0A6G1FDE6_9ORYZ|nr:hypothetical protein E2562_028828 [Oryza meyeriana var. granulata]
MPPCFPSPPPRLVAIGALCRRTTRSRGRWLRGLFFVSSSPGVVRESVEAAAAMTLAREVPGTGSNLFQARSGISRPEATHKRGE